MTVQLLPIGPPTEMVANVVYALPTAQVTLYTEAAAPTITQSGSLAFTASTPVALVEGSAKLTAPFIRATSTITVTLKRA